MKRTIGEQEYNVWKFPHPLIFHWCLNPGLAFNELFLGQRIPKETLIVQGDERPLAERQYVQCAKCGALHNCLLWKNAHAQFWNWFGLVCKDCKAKIPTLLNWWSSAIIILLFPIIRPIKGKYEVAALDRQAKKLSSATDLSLSAKPVSAWAMGLMFGAVMLTLTEGRNIATGELTVEALLIAVALWACAGMLFGFSMKLIMNLRR